MSKFFLGKMFMSVLFILTVSCKPPCNGFDEPEYTSLYIYKFMEGKDYSNHVIVIGSLQEGDTSAYYITGYEPIKLHGGYYLGGNIPSLPGPGNDNIHYLTLTYSDLESGNVPEDWFDHWWDYRILPEECVHEWVLYFGRSRCKNSQWYYKNSAVYNPQITLHVPVTDDVHTDTSLINKLIDEDRLIGYGLGGGNWCAPSYCFECNKTKTL